MANCAPGICFSCVAIQLSTQWLSVSMYVVDRKIFNNNSSHLNSLPKIDLVITPGSPLHDSYCTGY